MVDYVVLSYEILFVSFFILCNSQLQNPGKLNEELFATE